MALNELSHCKKCVTGIFECTDCFKKFCAIHFHQAIGVCDQCYVRNELDTSETTPTYSDPQREIQKKIRLENGAMLVAASVSRNIKVTKQGVAKNAVEIALEVQELVWGKDEIEYEENGS